MPAPSGDEWPLPRFLVVPDDYLHALGAVSVYYNLFENSFYPYFRHYLSSEAKLPDPMIEDWFGRHDLPARLNATQAVARFYERDPEVLKAIVGLISYFNACKQNRDLLVHSNALADPNQTVIDLFKRNRREFDINHRRIGLDHLRRIADETHDGWDYGTKIYRFIWTRSGTMPSGLHALALHSLPGIPQPPEVLTYNPLREAEPKPAPPL